MIKHYAKVEGHSHLLRDLETNAIINTDTFTSDHYSKLKHKRNSEKLKIENLENELKSVRSDLDEIKTLLRGFLNESR